VSNEARSAAASSPSIDPSIDPLRRTALVAGVLYLLTFLAVGTLNLYGPLLQDSAYVLTTGDGAGVRWGALIEVVVALACVGTALTLYPLLRRQGEAFALGFVSSRVVEAGLIFGGVISLLTLVGVHEGAGLAGTADKATLTIFGSSLVGIYKASFLLGQTLMPAMNAILLGALMYRTRLVPRIIPVLGLIGGPLMASSVVGQLIGINEQVSVWSGIALLPIFAWELSLGLWLTFKGFNRAAPILAAAMAHRREADAFVITTPSAVGTAGAA
jgi:hypothetical protein